MPPQDRGRKSLLMLAGTWGGGALGMIVSVLIGRVLGPAALGSIGFSTGIVGLLTAGAPARVPEGFIRFLCGGLREPECP